MGIQKIDSVMKTLFGTLEQKSCQSTKIWNVWCALVGPQLSGETALVQMKEGKLVIGVSHPVWLYELKRSCADLTQRMNEQLGKAQIQEIHFRIQSDIKQWRRE